MSDYDWVKRCSDEEINRLFDDVLLQSAFAKTPAWKRWAFGIGIPIGAILGFGTTAEVLARSSLYEQGLMLIGCLGYFGLWHIMRMERDHTKLQQAIRDELERRQRA